jgi:hypothetical protein
MSPRSPPTDGNALAQAGPFGSGSGRHWGWFLSAFGGIFTRPDVVWRVQVSYDSGMRPATGGTRLGAATMKFGERVRALRKAKGWSLRILAEKVDVGFTYLSRVENERLNFGDYGASLGPHIWLQSCERCNLGPSKRKLPAPECHKLTSREGRARRKLAERGNCGRMNWYGHCEQRKLPSEPGELCQR